MAVPAATTPHPTLPHAAAGPARGSSASLEYYRHFLPLIGSLRATLTTKAGREIRGGHRDKVHTVGWNSDGRRLASGSVDQTARVMDVERASISASKDAAFLLTLKHEGEVEQLEWDPLQPAYLATASRDRTVCIWDVRTPCTTAAHRVATSGENINICWSPDANCIAVGSRSDLVSFIDMRSGPSRGTIFHTLQSGVEVNELAYNFPGDLFCMSTGKGTVSMLDSTTFQPVLELATNTANCYCLEFDPSGRWMAAGGADAIVSVWEVEGMTQLRALGGSDWPIRSISFSHDGELIAQGSEDHRIDIYHVESGELIHSIPTTCMMNALAWSPNKYLLAYAGDEVDRHGKGEGTLRLFGLPR